MISITKQLPVPIKILVGQELISCNTVKMTQQTTEEYIQAQAGANETQYVAIFDLASMTTLIDSAGAEYKLPYENLAASSKQIYRALESIRDALDAKEIAESKESKSEPSDSTESAS